MTCEFTIELIEIKGDLCFVSGSALTELSVGDTFNALYQHEKKSQRKNADVQFEIQTLIVAGEPVDSVEAGAAVMVALVGDATSLGQAAEALRWKRKSGRYLRTSAISLTLRGSSD